MKTVRQRIFERWNATCKNKLQCMKVPVLPNDCAECGFSGTRLFHQFSLELMREIEGEQHETTSDPNTTSQP